MYCAVWVSSKLSWGHTGTHTHSYIHNHTTHTFINTTPKQTHKLQHDISLFPRTINFPELFPKISGGFTTCLTLILSRIIKSQRLPTKLARKSHLLQHPTLSSASEWLHNLHIVHQVHRPSVMGERKTLWGSYTRTLFTQTFYSLDDFRTPIDKQCLSHRPQDKTYRIPVGKVWALHGNSLKSLWIGNYKILFSRKKSWC